MIRRMGGEPAPGIISKTSDSLIRQIKAGAVARFGVKVAARGGNGGVAESGLDEVDGRAAVEGVTGVSVAHVPDVGAAARGAMNSVRALASSIRQSTNEVLMVAPTAFGFNDQVLPLSPALMLCSSGHQELFPACKRSSGGMEAGG